jgi:hypothetical protein
MVKKPEKKREKNPSKQFLCLVTPSGVGFIQTREGPPERAPVSWAGACSGAKTFGLKTLEQLLGWRGGEQRICIHD